MSQRHCPNYPSQRSTVKFLFYFVWGFRVEPHGTLSVPTVAIRLVRILRFKPRSAAVLDVKLPYLLRSASCSRPLHLSCSGELFLLPNVGAFRGVGVVHDVVVIEAVSYAFPIYQYAHTGTPIISTIPKLPCIASLGRSSAWTGRDYSRRTTPFPLPRLSVDSLHYGSLLWPSG